MGYYSRVVFPHLCDFVLSQAFIARRRAGLLADVAGAILEIGFGTGLNLAHYPRWVRRITTVDPNPGMQRLARRRVKRSSIMVDQHPINGERLPFASDVFDCVVSTFTLCSIDKVDQALGEAHRVLKPGGRFLFLEHGLSPAPRVQSWQRRLNWLEMRLADGCRLDRNIRELVSAQPYAAGRIENNYLSWAPKTHGYLYQGVMTK